MRFRTGSRYTGPAALIMAVAALMAASAPAQATGQLQGAAAGSISTLAGGTGGPGLATGVAIWYPCGVSYAGGSLYVGDGLVQRVTESGDRLTTAAGGVRSGLLPHERLPLGNGGSAGTAAVNACGTAVDGDGNVLFADTIDREVRVVAATSGTFYGQAMTAGDVYSVAGDGSIGNRGNGGPATKAALADPVSVAVDGSGNVVIADAGLASRKEPAEVQVVAARDGTFYGKKMTAGDIYRVAGEITSTQVGGNGGPAKNAGLGVSAGQVQVDGAGNLVLADASANSVRVIADRSGTFYGQQMTAGDIYAVAGDGSKGFSGDGGLATAAQLSGPAGVAVDGAGNLAVADSGNDRLRVVAAASGTFYGRAMTAGHIYTIAGCGAGTGCGIGEGGPALAGRLIDPNGVAVDGAGNLAVSEFGAGRISDDRRVRLVAAASGTFYGRAMTAGDIYTVAGNGDRGYSGDDGQATAAVMESTSDRMAVDAAGNVIVPAGQNNRIRVIPPRSGTFYGVTMTAGHIYTVAGGGFGDSGNGTPALRTHMNFPDGVAIDGHGNLVIADGGNSQLRVLAKTSGTFYGQKMTAGHVYLVAGTGKKRGFSGDGGPAVDAQLNVAGGPAVDGHGNLLVADQNNNRIRVVADRSGTFYGRAMTAEDIYTVAGDGTHGFSGDGGPATDAALDMPKAVAVDAHGNLVIADQGNSRIRVVAATNGTFYGRAMTAGDIYTVAGDGTRGSAGDGGPATSAALNSPTDVTVDSHGNLVIADQNANRVRVVAEASGTFYGKKMTPGDIYTVAGTGQAGFSGDGGPATSAMLLSPTGAVADSQGNLYIGDLLRVRKVAG